VIRRWRDLRHPERAGIPHPARPLEALGVSVLGLLWALVTFGLASIGHHALAPLALLAGLLALWGWRGNDWLWWFPATLVGAALLEVLWPLPAQGAVAPLGYVDLVALAVVVVAVARSLALRRPLVPRTALDPLVAGLLVAGFVGVMLERTGALSRLTNTVVACVVFYAATSVAARRGAARWVWPSFPLACALLGAHALWTAWGPRFGLPAATLARGATWGSWPVLALSQAVALAVTLGLALDAGRRGARRVWWGTVALGVAGLVALGPRGLRDSLPLTSHLGEPLEVAQAALVLGALAISARTAWRLGWSRPLERPRWTAVSLAMVVLVMLLPLADPFAGPAARLLSAVAMGLAAGTARADARTLAALERGQRAVPDAVARAREAA
jgi:hypothetical protein